MININNLSKSFGEKVVFNNLSFSLEKNKILVILGPSGCGKSTLLNIIGGIDKKYYGTVNISHNKISYVFQEDRLLPWLTVEENIKYVLGNKKYPQNLISFLGLEHLEKTLCKYLSGGQKQRVSIARAFAIKPSLILMDENLKSLDIQLKLALIKEINLFQNFKIENIIYVTHDVEEALLLADNILLLDKNGNIKNSIDINIEKEKRFLNRECLIQYEMSIYKSFGLK